MEKLEKKIEELESNEKWSDMMERIKELKEEIAIEKERLNTMMDNITTINFEEIKLKKKYNDMNVLVQRFNESETLEDKIKYYQYIGAFILALEHSINE
jgi:hypothetical protein